MYKKSTTIHGIMDIQNKTKDAFAAAKRYKNEPYKVFDEWFKSCFSKFPSVIVDFSMIR